MTKAVCYRCGSHKPRALMPCRACQAVPTDTHVGYLSIALSDSLSRPDQLEKYSAEIKAGGGPSIPGKIIARATELYSYDQLSAMISAENASSKTRKAAGVQKKKSSKKAQGFHYLHQVFPYQLKSSQLHKSPFWILSATIRDNASRIVELAEQKSLEIDHDVCQNARAELTNTRTRLNVELAWFPGVSPQRAVHCLGLLSEDAMSVRSELGLPTLAKLNLWAAAFEAIDECHDQEDLQNFITEFSKLADNIDPSEVLRDVNEDRGISKFPEIRHLDQIENALEERRRYYRNTVKICIDKFPSKLQLLTDLVEATTYSGEVHAPKLIDDIVDSYEIDIQSTLDDDYGKILKLLDAARSAALCGEETLNQVIDNLVIAAKNWDAQAQPIQVSAKAKGTFHNPSNDVAESIRHLALDLFNDHKLLDQSKKLTYLLQELFVEIPEISEQLDTDADTLADITNAKEKYEANKAQWEREIFYRVDVGAIFKNTLQISSEGVSWKGKIYPLDSISRVRWGGVSRSVNGIPTGTDYTVAFGDNASETIVHIRKRKTYSTFVGKIWQAVCLRLIYEMLEELKSGKSLYFGSTFVDDDGIELEKRKLFWSRESVKCKWSQVQAWSANGAFHIRSRNDKNTYISLSYIDVENTHLLEHMIRMKFKKTGTKLLSELLN